MLGEQYAGSKTFSRKLQYRHSWKLDKGVLDACATNSHLAIVGGHGESRAVGGVVDVAYPIVGVLIMQKAAAYFVYCYTYTGKITLWGIRLGGQRPLDSESSMKCRWSSCCCM